MVQIALDGPAGAGKSTIAKKIAKKKGYLYVDTGAMYRAIAYYCIENNVDINIEENVENQFSDIDIKLQFIKGTQRLFLNDIDVTEEIRDNSISMVSSTISAYPPVREFLLEKQRELARNNDVIMDGRDIGTVVLPNATTKIFLTASVKKRAMRRHWQLKSKGMVVGVGELMREIKKRDEQDTNREISPLKKADDAILFDNTKLNLTQSVREIIKIIEREV